MKFKVTIVFIFLLLFLFSFKEVYASEKRIAIDLSRQTLYAWEDGQIVYQTAISSGLPQSPTIRGTFRIYSKVPSQTMTGVSPVHGYYYLPNVTNVMYFSGAYSIHGTYWHNNFGTPMSNGCINAPLDAAAWLYNFAPTGTIVTIY